MFFVCLIALSVPVFHFWRETVQADSLNEREDAFVNFIWGGPFPGFGVTAWLQGFDWHEALQAWGLRGITDAPTPIPVETWPKNSHNNE